MKSKREICRDCGYLQRPRHLRVDAFWWCDKFYRRDPKNPHAGKVCGQCYARKSYSEWNKIHNQEQSERYPKERDFDLGRHCDRSELRFD